VNWINLTIVTTYNNHTVIISCLLSGLHFQAYNF